MTIVTPEILENSQFMQKLNREKTHTLIRSEVYFDKFYTPEEFDKNANEEVCKSTIEVMGLSWDRFCELRDKALISNKVSKFLNIKTSALIVAILTAIIFAIFSKKK